MEDRHPGREECLELLKNYGTPAHVVRHCIAVADAALAIARALVEKGFVFDLALVQSAGLLHDVARAETEHWVSGAEYARRLGFAKEAEIIRRHMNHSFDPDPAKLRELDLVCLGDRIVLEDRYVGFDARMDYVIKKAGGGERIEKMISESKKVNSALARNIEEVIGVSIDELMLEGNSRKAADEH
ncbi:MAG: HDIG domain-containing protein [Clostridiales bacterium]|nr:HDIG domain-containing protein [Clostridiales bacterium]